MTVSIVTYQISKRLVKVFNKLVELLVWIQTNKKKRKIKVQQIMNHVSNTQASTRLSCRSCREKGGVGFKCDVLLSGSLDNTSLRASEKFISLRENE